MYGADPVKRKALIAVTYPEVLENARKTISNCKVCPVCNGLACANTMPGPGSKAPGNGAHENWRAWHDVRIEMDVFRPDAPVDTATERFGAQLALPLLTGPIGALTQYSPTDVTVPFNDGVMAACAAFGAVSTFGDGVVPETFPGGMASIARHKSASIPILNPKSMEYLLDKIAQVNASEALAVGVVFDSAGLSFWTQKGDRFSSKTPEQLRVLRAYASKPFVAKGILSAKNAAQAVEAGADAIIVSNHGGRVLPYAPATAAVLPEIVEAVQGSAKIIVDGGIRTGADIFKALALGADAVMICRPIAVSWFGGGAEGVRLYFEKLRTELAEVMYMAGARSIGDISRDMIRL